MLQSGPSNARIDASSGSLLPGPLHQSTARSPTPYETVTESRTKTYRPQTSLLSRARPSTARPRTGVSTLGVENQRIVCAVSESRGVSPIVGLAFVNLDTGEAVLSQISDSQTYVRTVHKLIVFNPTMILMVSSAAEPKSKLFNIVEDTLDDIDATITCLDRHYWVETVGIEYIHRLAFPEDVEAIKTAVSGNYYSVCCLAAVLRYVEVALSQTLPYQSLRISYEPSEGAMMIDLATIRSLELVQNLQNPKSKHCLFGLMNQTLTPMGSRLLRSNIIQPLTSSDTLNLRYEALEELSTKEEMFFAVRQALKPFSDVDRNLTQLILEPSSSTLKETEQALNSVIMLKKTILLIPPILKALTGARCAMLQEIRALCASANVDQVRVLIDEVVNEDTNYAQRPLDLRNQRTYAIKSGVNGLLDVARQTYKESMTDALQHIKDLNETHNLALQTKFDNTRQLYMRLSALDAMVAVLPEELINVVRKKGIIECQTLNLVKMNQKIADAHTEVLLMSDKTIQELIARVREHMSALFKICEGIAMLDMLASFAHLVTSQDYVRPQLGETLAISAARHPILETMDNTKHVPNDIYASQQTRLQIITGCNMSGKSTYIRTVALLTVMAQIGSYVPARYAMIPIRKQLFARISFDDSIEANVSTFAAEMREAAFILRNIDGDSLAIIDELGRGTSARDGLAIALAIAEALTASRALVWFATHFRDLSRILAERNGVVAMHMQVDMSVAGKVEMLYRATRGTAEEEHYGLRLARIMALPPEMLEFAERAAEALQAHALWSKKRGSLGIIQARRTNLILCLKEQLVQAKQGAMDDDALSGWLKGLQREFVVRMTALDEEARALERRRVGQSDPMSDLADDSSVVVRSEQTDSMLDKVCETP